MNSLNNDLMKILATIDSQYQKKFETSVSVKNKYFYAEEPLNVTVKGKDLNLFDLSSEDCDFLISIATRSLYGSFDKDVYDEKVRKSKEISSKDILFKSTEMNKPLLPLKLTNYLYQRLGIDEESASLSFHSLNIYESGDFFDLHRDSVKETNMVATLVVTLPSFFIGGQLYFFEKENSNMYVDYYEILPTKVHATMFYSDVLHGVKEVTKGTKFSLVFNVIGKFKKNKQLISNLPDNVLFEKGNQVLQLMNRYKFGDFPYDITFDEMSNHHLACNLAFILNHKYTYNNLKWDSLKGIDKRFDLYLKEMCKHNYSRYLCLLTVKHMYENEYDLDDNDESIINKYYIKAVKVLDENNSRIKIYPQLYMNNMLGFDFERYKDLPFDHLSSQVGNQGTKEINWYKYAAIIIGR